MTTELPSYPAYKDSGLPWLEAIPEHWEVRRAKYLMQDRDDRWTAPEGTLLSVSQYTGVTKRRMREGTADPDTRSATLAGYKMAARGDLVVNIMLAWNGSLGVAPCAGVVSPAYCVYQLSLGNPWYFHHLLRCPVFRAEIKRRSRGVVDSRLRLYTDDLFRMPLVLPPEAEQRAIVRYLDAINERIDRFIRNRERLIEVLTEQKQAVINHAVTKGLDPNVKLKPSGIDWLGKIPEHWDCLSLKRVLVRLIDCEHKTAPQVDHATGYTVVRTSAVKNGDLRWEGTYETTEEAYAQWTQRGNPEAGDVIFTREAPAGEACAIPQGYTVCLGQRTVLMKLDKTMYDPNFLVYMIYQGPPADRIRLSSQGSTVGHFNMDDIGWMLVLKPSLQEQRDIVDAVGRQMCQLDSATSKARREITLIREYRTRLISDVVTGKVDVRGAPAGWRYDAEFAEADKELLLAAEEWGKGYELSRSDS